MVWPAEVQALKEGKEDLDNSWGLIKKQKDLLGEREGGLIPREAALAATTTKLDHRQAELTERELKTQPGEAALQYARALCCAAVYRGIVSHNRLQSNL